MLLHRVGYIHLIMGERGFFWMRRLLHISGGNRPTAFADKYSHDGDLAVAEETVLELLGFFDGVLQSQQAKGKRRPTALSQALPDTPLSKSPTCPAGSRYLVGDSLSAADLYWALGSMICIPPPQELVATDEINSYFKGNVADGKGRTAAEFLAVFRPTNSPFEAAITPLLRQHQEYIITSYCNYPLK